MEHQIGPIMRLTHAQHKIPHNLSLALQTAPIAIPRSADPHRPTRLLLSLPNSHTPPDVTYPLHRNPMHVRQHRRRVHRNRQAPWHRAELARQSRLPAAHNLSHNPSHRLLRLRDGPARAHNGTGLLSEYVRSLEYADGRSIG
jgi:hypothetical protein